MQVSSSWLDCLLGHLLVCSTVQPLPEQTVGPSEIEISYLQQLLEQHFAYRMGWCEYGQGLGSVGENVFTNGAM